jgi:aspartate carbamoyltransferase catalytic subunit
MLNDHLVSIDDIELGKLESFFQRVLTLKHLHLLQNQDRTQADKWHAIANSLQGKVLTTLFYEPSTRTRLSFESAAQQLGGAILTTENAGEFSSTIKGESLEDSIRTATLYSHCIVLRHPECGAAGKAAAVSHVPIINAGDGDGEHPTQALLDFYTIWEKFSNRTNLTLTVVGDLKYGRTVHSLLKLVARLNDTSLGMVTKVNLVAPTQLTLPEEMSLALASNDVQVVNSSQNLDDDCLKQSDIIYMTRTQSERGAAMHDEENFALTISRAQLLPEHAVIMHPMPRNAELPIDVDTLKQAHYFGQAQNGLYVRMALLELLLG